MDATNSAALDQLDALIRKQRQQIAIQLRVTREDKALREQMAILLDAAGVERTTVNGYDVVLVRRVDRPSYVTVTPQEKRS